ncbi:MAG: DUF3575 domain-containing protein [Bacteroidaceae bacterium]|nr:DUF3575 domain-containing protein [Bacteroidaceae bacterium]
MQNIKQAVISAILLFISIHTIADEKTKSKERWGFHTNVIEWVMTTPNIGVEYDVVHRDTRKTSIMLSGKYNWNLDHEYNASNSNRYVYNNLGLKAELRFYFRTREKEGWEDLLLRNKSINGIGNKLYIRKGLLLSKDKPRTYRAYYIAPYVSYDKYSIKFGDTGKQGTAMSAGVSFGYNIPLYQYNNGHAIDLELGASLGFVYTGYDKFKYNKEDACYTLASEERGHLVPFPLITGVRMGFVYRYKSIRKQLNTYDRTSLELLHNMYELNNSYNYLITKYFDPTTNYYISPDSVAAWNKHVKEHNAVVQKFRQTYANADSAALPVELAQAYEYIDLPQNGLSKFIRKSLPNKNITSISELENDYLNSIVKKYSGIKDENSNKNGGNFNEVIESVETALLKSYETEKGRYDSTPSIPMLQYLITAINRLNEYSIKAHNEKYFISKKEYDDSVIAKIVRIKNTNGIHMKNSAISFLAREDTLYMKRNTKLCNGYELKGLNAEIEMFNKIKMMQLQNSTISPVAAPDNGNGEQKAEDETKPTDATNIETAVTAENKNTGNENTPKSDAIEENANAEAVAENTEQSGNEGSENTKEAPKQ